MTTPRYDPWNMMEQLRREMDRYLTLPTVREDTSHIESGEWAPAVDIREEQDRYVLLADVPGVAPDSIELTMDNGILSIRGQRPHETPEGARHYKRMERPRGGFLRRFSMPDNTDPETIAASCADGVLEVSIPKSRTRESRRIEVK